MYRFLRDEFGTVFVQMFDAALAFWYGAPPALFRKNIRF